MRKHLLINIVGLLLGIFTYFYLSYSGEAKEIKEYLLSGLAGIGILYLLYAVTVWLNYKLPWLRQPGLRLLSGILINSLLAYFIIFGLMALYHGYSDLPISTLIKLAILVTVIILIISIIYFAVYAYHQYASVQIQTIQTEREQIDLQLQALKTQLSPHFLFNSFNTISFLISQDLRLSETFIRQLAKLYQYILSSYEKQWVSVREELELVEAYHFLLQTRFEQLLHINIKLEESVLESRIPPLSLQMLVENAVKHNQMRADMPLNIEIANDQKWIWVENNKTLPPRGISSFKIGLNNLSARYKLLNQKDIDILNEQSFTVKLPIIR